VCSISAGASALTVIPGLGDARCEVVGEADQPGLGRRVVGADDPAGEGRDRGDEQDPAEAAVLHPGDDALGQQERRTQVDAMVSSHTPDVDLVERRPGRQPVVGDQRVDRPQLLLDLVDEQLRGPRDEQIGRDRDRAAAGRDDLVGDRLGELDPVAVVDRDQPCPGRPAAGTARRPIPPLPPVTNATRP